MIKFCRKPLKYDPNFDLIILTNLALPNYDPNVTNHVCLVNFYMTIEGLTQNLLSMVVANERPDLEKSFAENSEATFDNIKLLRETETRIIKNLTGNIEKILANDKLIEILKESKQCAETVAEKLKRINNTN
jgi:dynein heavy chain, axonemal